MTVLIRTGTPKGKMKRATGDLGKLFGQLVVFSTPQI